MAQAFNNAVMTDSGAELLTRAQAGEITLEFTRLVTGNGHYTEDEKKVDNLKKAIVLKSPQNSYTFSEKVIESGNSVKLIALITNQDPVSLETLVTEGYYINEMGIYCKPKDGTHDEEVLYSIAITYGEAGDFMPPFNGYNPAQIIQEYYLTVDNTENVKITTSGAALPADAVIDKKEDLEAKVDKFSKVVLSAKLSYELYKELKAEIEELRQCIVDRKTCADTVTEDGEILTTESGETILTEVKF